MRVLGLMSGTSADGVDAVLANFSGPPQHPRWRIESHHFNPYPAKLQRQLVGIGQGQLVNSETLLELAEAVTEQQALAARACDPQGHAQLVGCHGQTLWHRPPQRGKRGASWQIVQGQLLAELLATPVIFDFRSADLALGGQGAPLVPPADQALLGRCGGWRAVLNLGGIANLTLIPPAQGPDSSLPVRGWDCGPANTLLDLATLHFSGGKQTYDDDGAWARQGQIDEALIQRWLAEPYFQSPPPKSTGRELFGQADLERRLAEIGERNPADALATLSGFSAAVVAQELDHGPKPIELLLAGGGCRNSLLVEQLHRRCRGLIVRQLAEFGIGEAEREALAFALLAWWHVLGHQGNLPSVTGASGGAVLGLCAHPQAGRCKRTLRGAPRRRWGFWP